MNDGLDDQPLSSDKVLLEEMRLQAMELMRRYQIDMRKCMTKEGSKGASDQEIGY